MKIALITGASSGLGAEFAHQIAELDASKGAEELWLLARRQDRLEALAQELDRPCKILALDLLESEALETLKAELAAAQPQISYLVNSAGLGRQGPFADQAASCHQEMVDLNIRALLDVTYLAKPYLVPGSQVLLISSVAAFLPQPAYAVYAATKTFILNFSRALRREWQDEGIKVTAVCPNLMETDFLTKAGIEGKTQSLKSLGLEPVSRVVKTSLRRSAAGKDLAISSGMGKAIHLASKILPTSFILWLEKVFGMY